VRFVAVGKTQIIGLENIPTDRAVLFIGNHRSMLDVVICGSVIPVPVGFISKIELEKIPLLHMQMKDINCLFLDRSDDRKALKTILKAIELVKGGQSMFIFPEGTRSKEEGKFLPFHAGSFKIATKAKAPIVPVTIVGTGDILEDHFPRIKAAPVVVEFGKPIETAEMGRDEQKELPDRVRNLIIETYERNRKLL
jgi:1-acyl-sn-glycerol-3-phosphate acyltransferase